MSLSLYQKRVEVFNLINPKSLLIGSDILLKNRTLKNTKKEFYKLYHIKKIRELVSDFQQDLTSIEINGILKVLQKVSVLTDTEYLNIIRRWDLR